jgi:hypothetical protein
MLRDAPAPVACRRILCGINTGRNPVPRWQASRVIRQGTSVARAHDLIDAIAWIVIVLESPQIFCWDIANALRYVHSQGVLYCDLHPNSVMVDENGNSKVMQRFLLRVTAQRS